VKKFIRTKDIADMFSVKVTCVRNSLYRNGHFCGIKPIRPLDSVLMWDIDEINQKIVELCNERDKL